MENSYLSALVGEMRSRLIGRNVGSVLLSGTQMLCELRPLEGEALYVSLDRTDPSIFLSSKTVKQFTREANAAAPFAAHLKKYVMGAEIIAINKPPLDRVVHLELEKFGLAGDRERSHFVLALTGRSANAYLFNAERRLVAMLDERGELPDDRLLDVETGRLDAATFDRELDDSMSQADIEEKFFGSATVFGPQLKKEFAARCRDAAPVEAMRSLLSDLFDRAPQALLYSRLPLAEMGNHLTNLKAGLLLSHIPLAQAEGFACREFPSLSQAAEAHADLRGRQRALRNEYDRTRQLLAQAVKRQQTTLSAIRRDRERFEEPERLKRYGDLLLANLATARVEGPTARVIDYFDENQPEVAIQIEENRPLQQTAAKYFARYQKAQRALTAINEREQQVVARLTPLQQLFDSIQSDPTADEIAETRAAAERALGIKRKVGPGVEKRSKKKVATTGRRFRTTDGFEVLVGKSDRENDELTFRTARPADIWLHAADYPGSHVVIRNPARTEVPQRSIAEAAELAAFYSQAKREAKAAVHYTQRKFVTKPPRAKPGLVRLSSFKTILVAPRCALEQVE
ncbi:MAG TPA: NFACT RNA binding domain-containing protein [Blastocatellia bacterium]|nr:NFACT RNA binding domain-containing protein [Blastocatellia bacterium]